MTGSAFWRWNGSTAWGRWGGVGCSRWRRWRLNLWATRPPHGPAWRPGWQALARGRAALLYAYGTLVGNTDMHNGNLSFTSEHGRPYTLAPAYDMLPMGFAPRASGALPTQIPPARLHASVDNATWHQALPLAEQFLARLQAETRFSAGFAPCIDHLSRHIQDARTRVRGRADGSASWTFLLLRLWRLTSPSLTPRPRASVGGRVRRAGDG